MSNKKAAPAGSAEAQAQPETPKVKVRITREAGHRHAGEKHEKDAVITVSAADAKIIVETFKAGDLVEEN